MTPNPNQSDAELCNGRRVLDLLRRQRELYHGLKRLAECQRGLIAANDNGKLLSVLADRQKITQALLEVGQRLAPHREQWSQTRQSLMQADRDEAEGILTEVSELLAGIISLDEQDARLLSARRNQAAEVLKSSRTDRAAVSAYATEAVGGRQSGGRFNEES